MWEKNGECVECPDHCVTCKNDKECIKCAENRVNPGKCPCKAGYFEKKGKCEPCGFKCKTCKDKADNCTDCIADRTVIPDCDKCPVGRFNDNVHPECQKCTKYHKECIECDADECKKCGVNRVAPTCVCNHGFTEINGSCEKCKYTCNKCTGKTHTCTECSHKTRQELSECKCVDGFYDDGKDNKECKKCSFRCLTCKNDKDECETCSKHRVKAPSCACKDGMVEEN